MNRLKQAVSRVLPKNPFARGVSMLVGGTASAQLLTVLAAPLLTRLYSPEDFGLLAVYGSLLAIISVIASLRYELAIPLPEDDQEAANVAVLSLLLIAGTTLLSVLATVLFGDHIANALGVPALVAYLWLLPVGVLLGGVYTVFNYWAIRTKDYNKIAGTKIIQSIAGLVIQITGYKLGVIAMISGQIAGQSAGTFNLAKSAITLRTIKKIDGTRIIQAARRYKKFPIYSTGGALFNTASAHAVPLFFSIFFGPIFAGFYVLAQRVLLMPAALIGTAVSQVFLSEGKTELDKQMLPQKTLAIHSKLAFIAMPAMYFFLLYGPMSFSYIFGNSWEKSGLFSQILAPWIYLVFTASPISSVNIILEKQKFSFIFDGVILVTRLGSLYIGYQFLDIYGSVLLFGIVSSILVFVFLYFTFNFLSVSVFRWISIHVKTLLLGLVLFLFPYLALVKVMSNEIFAMSMHIVIAMSLYVYMLIKSPGSKA